MLTINEIKNGTTLIADGDPYTVLNAQHSKTGRAGAVLRTKIKNLRTGNILNKTFQGAEKIEEAEVEKRKGQFLYSDGAVFYFMDDETYEQFEIPAEVIGDQVSFLKEETEVDLLYFNGNPINIKLPVKMDFKVVEAPPAVKGNTADGGSKQVTLETGTNITTPLFVEQEDFVRINTETGEYVERVK